MFSFFMKVLAHSTPTHIILNNAASATSGVFRCEVSAGPPRFSTASRTTHLQIVGEFILRRILKVRDDKFGLFMREIRLHQKLQEDENMLIYHMKVYFHPVKLFNFRRSADLQAPYLRSEVSLQPRVSSEPEL